MKSAPGGAGVYVTVPYLLSFLEKLRIFEISDANEDNASRLTDEQIKQLQTIRTELAPLIQRRKEIEIQLKKEKTYGSKALFELQKSELQRERKSTIEKAEGVGLPIMKKPSGSILARHPELESTYRTYEEDVKRKYEINRTKISEVIKLKREKKKIEESLRNGGKLENFIEIVQNISKTTDTERKEITTLFEYYGMFEQNSDETVKNSVEDALNNFVNQSTPSKTK